MVAAGSPAAGVTRHVVAQDLFELTVRTDRLWRRGAKKRDYRRAQGGGDVQRAGVVADDQLCPDQQSNKGGQIGLAGEIEQVGG